MKENKQMEVVNRKYEFTGDTKIVFDRILHRIRAVRDFGTIKSGDLGGWIESEHNLSHDGSAWVCGNAVVYGNADVHGFAVVCGNADICDDARVYGETVVSGNARICGNAEVKSSSDYMVFKNSWSSKRWFTYTASNKRWAVGCFYGTGEELIKKAYEDSKLSGLCYEAIVKAVEEIENAKKGVK